MTSFILENNHSILFQGKEIGGSINPLEMEILFSDADYEITYYNTALSERAWEKIFFLSILYYNDFIQRHALKIQEISTPKERKNNDKGGIAFIFAYSEYRKQPIYHLQRWKTDSCS